MKYRRRHEIAGQPAECRMVCWNNTVTLIEWSLNIITPKSQLVMHVTPGLPPNDTAAIYAE